MAKLEVRLSGQQLEALKGKASAVGLSVSAFVRRELGLEGVEKGPLRSDPPVHRESKDAAVPSEREAIAAGDFVSYPKTYGSLAQLQAARKRGEV